MNQNNINFGGNNKGSREPGQDIMSTLDQNSGFQEKDKARTIIKVMGVGGGGNNAINHMYMQNIEGVSFVVLNTDRQQLNESPVPPRRAKPRSLHCSTTIPRWSSSPLVWVAVLVPVPRLLWHALPMRRASSPSVL